jgi:hypothetical protein
MSSGQIRFRAELRPQRRGLLGFELPPSSARALGTRGQVAVTAEVAGVAYQTIAFPRGDGTHFIFVKAAVRRRANLSEGQSVEVSIEQAPARGKVPLPEELAAELAKSSDARDAWDALTPAARQIASRWIGGAKSEDVRVFRSRDVVRRALRYHRFEGPFYPTEEDQRLLVRPTRSRKPRGQQPGSDL